EEAGLLDRIPDGPPQFDGRLVGDRAIADADVSAGEVDEPVDQLQCSGLAAAGGTDEADEFTGFDFEVQFVESGTGRTGVDLGGTVEGDRGARGILSHFTSIRCRRGTSSPPVPGRAG